MRSDPTDTTNRLRQNLVDLTILGAAAAVAVQAVVELGLLGLGVGSVATSVAAALVISRQIGSHDPGVEPTTGGQVVTTDGGRVDD